MSYYTNVHISDELKSKVLREMVEPNYIDEIKENISLVKYFRRFGLGFESFSKIFVGVSSILSFSAGIYQITALSFMAGVSNVISLVFLQFASYSYRESKKNENVLTGIFRKIQKGGETKTSEINNSAVEMSDHIIENGNSENTSHGNSENTSNSSEENTLSPRMYSTTVSV